MKIIETKTSKVIGTVACDNPDRDLDWACNRLVHEYEETHRDEITCNGAGDAELPGCPIHNPLCNLIIDGTTYPLAALHVEYDDTPVIVYVKRWQRTLSVIGSRITKQYYRSKPEGESEPLMTTAETVAWMEYHGQFCGEV